MSSARGRFANDVLIRVMEGGGRSASIIYQLEFARRERWSSRIANRGAGSGRNSVFRSNLQNSKLYTSASLQCVVYLQCGNWILGGV